MPAKSQAQREYLNARFGHHWVKLHHFDNTGPLVEHVSGKKPGPKPAPRARPRKKGKA